MDMRCKKDVEWVSYDGQRYWYSMFGQYESLEITKSGRGHHDLGDDLVAVLRRIRPPKLGCFLGFDSEGEGRFFDVQDAHTLVSGMTRYGKTTWINTAIASLGHFHHPEYLKLCVLEGKAGSLQRWEKVIDYTPCDVEKITNKIVQLGRILSKRKKKIEQGGGLSCVKEVNAWAYRSRKKKAVWPFVVVFFDEFQFYINSLKDRKKFGEEGVERELGEEHPISILHNLAAQGAGLGILLVFSTQCPYAECIKGPIKANFGRKISFKLSESPHEKIALGARDGSNLVPMNLERGELIAKFGSTRKKYRGANVASSAIAEIVKRWKAGGFDFSL